MLQTVLLIALIDDIWLCIIQGVSGHINANSEKLRALLMPHQGKEKLEVRRDDFVRGKQNAWHTVLFELSGKIKDRVGEQSHAMV